MDAESELEFRQMMESTSPPSLSSQAFSGTWELQKHCHSVFEEPTTLDGYQVPGLFLIITVIIA